MFDYFVKEETETVLPRFTTIKKERKKLSILPILLFSCKKTANRRRCLYLRPFARKLSQNENKKIAREKDNNVFAHCPTNIQIFPFFCYI